MQSETVNILGVGVSAINMSLALNAIDNWIQARQRQVVCVANVHTVMECQRDAVFREIYSHAGMVTPDGMPLVWVSHLQGFSQVGRVYGPDLMLAVCESGIAKGYRHFFYGGAAGVTERLAESLSKRFPGLQVVGSVSPPFRALSADERKKDLATINAAEPDIVWVGLGAPKQEYWMHESRPDLHAPILIGVGAAFDFHAGVKKQAPVWMQRLGLEWFFRLMSEPRRLWKRYLINNPIFVLLVLTQLLHIKQYNLER